MRSTSEFSFKGEREGTTYARVSQEETERSLAPSDGDSIKRLHGTPVRSRSVIDRAGPKMSFSKLVEAVSKVHES